MSTWQHEKQGAFDGQRRSFWHLSEQLTSDQPLILVSFCQVLLGCQFSNCSVGWGLQDCRCTACLPTTGGPERERELMSHPSLGSLKSLAAPPTTSSSLPPSAWCSRHTDHTHQALIYSIYTILPSPLWLWGIWGMPLPLPAAHGASSILLNVSQSVAVGGVPSHRALLAVGSLPCGGSDHSTVLTTRDLAPQPTVIEVTSQAIPWWIIKRPETELKVT